MPAISTGARSSQSPATSSSTPRKAPEARRPTPRGSMRRSSTAPSAPSRMTRRLLVPQSTPISPVISMRSYNERSPPDRIDQDQEGHDADRGQIEAQRGLVADLVQLDLHGVWLGRDQQRHDHGRDQGDDEDDADPVHEGEYELAGLLQPPEDGRQHHRADGGGQGAGFRGPLPEQAQHEDDDDARREEARELLDELEGLIKPAQQGTGGQDADDHGGDGGNA